MTGSMYLGGVGRWCDGREVTGSMQWRVNVSYSRTQHDAPSGDQIKVLSRVMCSITRTLN